MHQRAASYNRRFLFYTLFLAYIAGGIMSILPGPTLSLLARNTHVSTSVAGWIFTSGAGGFALGVLLAGALAGKMHPKTILMIGMWLMAIGAIIYPVTSQFPVLLVTALCKGIGFGALDVSINILMTLAFHDSLGESFNSLHSSYGIGALVAPALLTFTLTVIHDFRMAYFTGVVLCILCVIMLACQNAPSTSVPQTGSAQQGTHSTISTRQILQQPLIWLMALEFFFYIIAEIGFSNWIVTTISQTAAISLALAAPSATAFWTGLTLSRLLGGQVLRRAILSENQVLYLCIIGGGLSCLLVAIFPGQLLISFSASALAGFFFGPIYPGLMAIAARWYINAPNTLSGMMLFSCGISGMIFPAMMGLLIPVIGYNWVMTVPALGCLLILAPFILATVRQRRALQLQSAEATIGKTLPLTTHVSILSNDEALPQ
jgi:fucose permease